jgi:hypothetical protein
MQAHPYLLNEFNKLYIYTWDLSTTDMSDMLGIDLKTAWEEYFYIKLEKPHRI